MAKRRKTQLKCSLATQRIISINTAWLSQLNGFLQAPLHLQTKQKPPHWGFWSNYSWRAGVWTNCLLYHSDHGRHILAKGSRVLNEWLIFVFAENAKSFCTVRSITWQNLIGGRSIRSVRWRTRTYKRNRMCISKFADHLHWYLSLVAGQLDQNQEIDLYYKAKTAKSSTGSYLSVAVLSALIMEGK